MVIYLDSFGLAILALGERCADRISEGSDVVAVSRVGTVGAVRVISDRLAGMPADRVSQALNSLAAVDRLLTRIDLTDEILAQATVLTWAGAATEDALHLASAMAIRASVVYCRSSAAPMAVELGMHVALAD